MKGPKGVFVAAILLWIAAGAQQALAHRLNLFGAAPDFLLISVSCLCLFANRIGGALIGFFAGLSMGAVVGANMTQYVFSRTLVGFFDAWSKALGLDANLLTAAVNGLLVTVAAQLLQMFFAPPAGITSFLGATIASAVVNGVLAIPVYALLKRIFGSASA